MDTQGHDAAANYVQQDTQGTAGIQKDTSLCRFGTMRPGVKSRVPDRTDLLAIATAQQDVACLELGSIVAAVCRIASADQPVSTAMGAGHARVTTWRSRTVRVRPPRQIHVSE